jgi:hypothetical protein
MTHAEIPNLDTLIHKRKFTNIFYWKWISERKKCLYILLTCVWIAKYHTNDRSYFNKLNKISAKLVKKTQCHAYQKKNRRINLEDIVFWKIIYRTTNDLLQYLLRKRRRLYACELFLFSVALIHTKWVIIWRQKSKHNIKNFVRTWKKLFPTIKKLHEKQRNRSHETDGDFLYDLLQLVIITFILVFIRKEWKANKKSLTSILSARIWSATEEVEEKSRFFSLILISQSRFLFILGRWSRFD